MVLLGQLGKRRGMTAREAWLARRKQGIGASDAAAVMGCSPYKTNVALWEEKTGRRAPEDIGDKPYVQYGIQAEESLRALFALDYPAFQVEYDAYAMVANCPDAPFAFATLDGALTEKKTGARGILEIKTTEILQGMQWRQWKDRVPQQYYIQILHQFLATGYSFACLKAQIKYRSRTEAYGMSLQTRHYWFTRDTLLEDIAYLKQQELAFWRCVEDDRRPNLILPTI